MHNLQKQLIAEAKAKYGKIFPCGEKTTLNDCFTHEKVLGVLNFWFNTAKDTSTRMITVKTGR